MDSVIIVVLVLSLAISVLRSTIQVHRYKDRVLHIRRGISEKEMHKWAGIPTKTVKIDENTKLASYTLVASMGILFGTKLYDVTATIKNGVVTSVSSRHN